MMSRLSETIRAKWVEDVEFRSKTQKGQKRYWDREMKKRILSKNDESHEIVQTLLEDFE